MSMETTHYVIFGYDLTNIANCEKICEDWRWTDEGERLFCNQVQGRIQLFDGGAYNHHMYLGYILWAVDGDGNADTKFCVEDLKSLIADADAGEGIYKELKYLKEQGLLLDDDINNLPQEIMCFAEYY